MALKHNIVLYDLNTIIECVIELLSVNNILMLAF